MSTVLKNGATATRRRKFNLLQFARMEAAGEPIVMVTAYDSLSRPSERSLALNLPSSEIKTPNQLSIKEKRAIPSVALRLRCPTCRVGIPVYTLLKRRRCFWGSGKSTPTGVAMQPSAAASRETYSVCPFHNGNFKYVQPVNTLVPHRTVTVSESRKLESNQERLLFKLTGRPASNLKMLRKVEIVRV